MHNRSDSGQHWREGRTLSDAAFGSTDAPSPDSGDQPLLRKTKNPTRSLGYFTEDLEAMDARPVADDTEAVTDLRLTVASPPSEPNESPEPGTAEGGNVQLLPRARPFGRTIS
jgi:hypothetical protein